MNIVIGSILFVSLISVIGFLGVQKTGNYESEYGFMFFYGALIAIVLLILAFLVNLGMKYNFIGL